MKIILRRQSDGAKGRRVHNERDDDESDTREDSGHNGAFRSATGQAASRKSRKKGKKT